MPPIDADRRLTRRRLDRRLASDRRLRHLDCRIPTAQIFPPCRPSTPSSSCSPWPGAPSRSARRTTGPTRRCSGAARRLARSACGRLVRACAGRSPGRSSSRSPLIALVGLVQLVPLSPSTIARVSPATDAFLRQFDVAYQIAASSGAPATRIRCRSTPSSTLAWPGGARVARPADDRRRARPRPPFAVAPSRRASCSSASLVALAGIVQSGLYTRDPNPMLKIYGFWETGQQEHHAVRPVRQPQPLRRVDAAGAARRDGLLHGARARAACAASVPTFRDRVLWFSSPEASRVVLVGLAVLVMGLSLVLTLSRSGTACFLIALALTGLVSRPPAVGRRAPSRVARLRRRAGGVQPRLGGPRRGHRALLRGRHRLLVALRHLEGHVADPPGVSLAGHRPEHVRHGHGDLPDDRARIAPRRGAQRLPAAALGRRRRHRACRHPRHRPARPRDPSPIPRRAPTTRPTGWIRVGAATGLVAIALQSIVEFSLQMPGIAALFAIVAAMAIWQPGSGSRRCD